MQEFNPDQYRTTLRERLGIKKKLPMPGLVDTVNSATSSISTNSAEFGNGDAGAGAGAGGATSEKVDLQPDPTSKGVDQNLLKDLGADVAPEGGEEINQEQIAPAMALLHTTLQSVDEQTRSAQDHATGVMWRSFHNYIWKNRNKIAKKMMDDAQ